MLPILYHNVLHMPQTLHQRDQAERDRSVALEKDAADFRGKVETSGDRLNRLENVS